MKQLGFMNIPEKFRYRQLYERGKPDHSHIDSFTVKHPPMPLSKRAKIFSPFDALKGFHEALAEKEKECEKEQSPDNQDML